MPREAASPASPGLLFALRLHPVAPGQRLQGEIEQVMSGERCRFVGGGELLAWLLAHVRADDPRPSQGSGETGPGPADRDATM
jgi:hypothetical protein